MKMQEIRKAKENEFSKIKEFYELLIDMMQGNQYIPKWEKGVYPSDEYILSSLRNNTLWVCEYDNQIAAAMVVNHEYNEGYEKAKWLVKAEKSEVLIIHILGVMPTFQGMGIAGLMVEKAIETAKEAKCKAIRLDVLIGNIPAEKLYLKHGFKYADMVNMFYEDTGWTDFKLFEYIV